MSVVQTIYTFLRAERLSREWITPQTLHLIFRNILLEERQDVRDLSIRAWNHVIGHLDNSGLYPTCVQPYIQEWFNLALIPAVDGYASLAFAKADTGARRSVDAHDVDKAMMASDFSLIDEDLVLRNRLEAVEALTQVARCGHADVSRSARESATLLSPEAYHGEYSNSQFFRTCYPAFYCRRAHTS
jgi:TATA-binding protein-associated factor